MIEHRRLRVYIAGPITQGDTVENIWNGIRWGKRMVADGLAPYIPHLDAYMTLAVGAEAESTRNAMLEWDVEWIAVSDALYRLPGASRGADVEVRVAKELNIPVFEEQSEMAPIRYHDLLRFAQSKNLTGLRR